MHVGLDRVLHYLGLVVLGARVCSGQSTLCVCMCSDKYYSDLSWVSNHALAQLEKQSF